MPLIPSRSLEFCISMSAGPPCPQSLKVEVHPERRENLVQAIAAAASGFFVIRVSIASMLF